ncbi:MAG: 16S rRNA (adenine(1518)-N(6)/adenine(1519)-N(6))-dimethyltransferase RsmA [Deltaproteobacteria bacterium]|nr:16S rRNA (adenine(1518)-N(6)/adenine(1519)-N(6))-dimethyltransferase RsmA [Deltaproteobacteria bacterium]
MMSPKQALKILGRRPTKGLGQHFLIHQATAEKIAAAIHPGPGDVVVEIGAGLGALTLPLSRSGALVIAVEVDAELVKFLRKQFEKENGKEVKIECMDILELDLMELHGQFQKKMKIIGNLPYNISSPVMFKLMEGADYLKEAVLMLQDEVAERVLAGPGNKDYGILSVMVAYHSECRRVMRLKPSQFHPPPKVDSQVIGLLFRDRPLTPQVEASWLLQTVKAAFSHRRKTLRNSLLASKLGNLTPDLVNGVLQEASIEANRRPESLTLEEFLRLAKGLEEIGRTKLVDEEK